MRGAVSVSVLVTRTSPQVDGAIIHKDGADEMIENNSRMATSSLLEI